MDVTGLPLCVRAVPASTSEAKAVELILEDLSRKGADKRLELVLVDRGPRRRRHFDSRLGLTARFAGSARTSHHATSTVRRSFNPYDMRGGSRWPTGTWHAADVWLAALRTRWRQPLGGCTSLQSPKSFERPLEPVMARANRMGRSYRRETKAHPVDQSAGHAIDIRRISTSNPSASKILCASTLNSQVVKMTRLAETSSARALTAFMSSSPTPRRRAEGATPI